MCSKKVQTKWTEARGFMRAAVCLEFFLGEGLNRGLWIGFEFDWRGGDVGLMVGRCVGTVRWDVCDMEMPVAGVA